MTRRPRQDEYGRIVLSARLVLFVLGTYAVMLGLVAILPEELDPVLEIVLAGWAIIRSSGQWSGASVRFRAATVIAVVLAVVAPIAALAMVPESERSGWLPAVPVEAAASLVVVAAFIGVTQIRSFAPPYGIFGDDDHDGGIRPERHWTAEERRKLLARSGPLTFRTDARMGMAALGWVIAAVLPFEFVGTAANREWTATAVSAVLLVVAAWCAVRAPFVRLVIDADAVTAHNIFRTHRVPWTDIAGVVPAGRDNRLTFVRTDDRSVVASNWSGTLRPRFQVDPRLQPLLNLLGPEAR